jgi:hypothetical protein
MDMQMNLTGLDGVLKTLKSLPPEVVSKRGGVVRQSLAAGMRVIQKEARKNLVRSTASAGKTGVSYGSGLTAKNVIYKRKNMPKGEKGERLIMTVAYKQHPSFSSTYKNKPIKFNDIAFMLEYGTVNQQAEPWLRPAFMSKREQALSVVQSDLVKRLDKVVTKLALANKR